MASSNLKAANSKRPRIGSENCPSCDKNIAEKDSAINCSICEILFCNKCAKIPDELIILFNSGASNLMWTCQGCKTNFPSMSNMKSSLTDLISNNDARFGNLERKLDDMDATISHKVTKRIDTLKQELKTDIEVQVKNTFTTELRKELREIEDQKRRVSNIICFNMPESNKQKSDDKKEEDIRNFKTICSAIGVEEVGINSCFRIGKPGEGATRPMKIILSDKRQRNKLIENAKSIGEKCHGQLKKCILVKDLTPRQRDENKLRRAERIKETNKNQDALQAKDNEEMMDFNNTTIISQPLLQPLHMIPMSPGLYKCFNSESTVKTSTPAHKTGKFHTKPVINSNSTIDSTLPITVPDGDDTVIGGILMEDGNKDELSPPGGNS